MAVIKTHAITLDVADKLRRWFTLGELRNFVDALVQAGLNDDTPLRGDVFPLRVEYDPEDPNPDRDCWRGW